MSRERLFDALWWVIYGAIAGLGIFAGTVAGAAFTQPATVMVEQPELLPGTRNPGAPIFQCTGAGDAGISISRGGDGSSIFIWCPEVKS